MSDTIFVTNLGGALGYGMTGGYSPGQTLAASLTGSAASLSAKTTVTASYATLASLSLAAGTWLIVAHASVGADNLGAALATSGIFGVRIHNVTGAASLASTHGSVRTEASTFSAQLTSVSLMTVATLSTTSTIALQIDGSTTLAAYHLEQGSGASETNATRITAIRIA